MEDLISQLVALYKGVWKYRFWAVATAWIVLIVGTAAVYAVPNQYDSKARVFVDTQSILKPLLAGMTTVPNVEQQVSIMSRTLLTRPNVEKVIRMVDLDLKSKTVKDHEKLVDDLMKDIKITGMAQNDIYTISYTHENPKVVRDVVQAFLTIFVENSFGDKKQDSQKAIVFINDQIKNYEEKLLAAETALKEFKLKNIGLLPKTGGDYGSKL
ncbi:MAG TPA: Wzz/FepE/Etk N-terminal domain-containing protein, partial [Burkholderiaceae bacterium]